SILLNDTDDCRNVPYSVRVALISRALAIWPRSRAAESTYRNRTALVGTEDKSRSVVTFRRNAKIRKIAVAAVPRPEAHHASIVRAELSDLQCGRFNLTDIYLNRSAFYDDSEPYPLWMARLRGREQSR